MLLPPLIHIMTNHFKKKFLIKIKIQEKLHLKILLPEEQEKIRIFWTSQLNKTI